MQTKMFAFINRQYFSFWRRLMRAWTIFTAICLAIGVTFLLVTQPWDSKDQPTATATASASAETSASPSMPTVSDQLSAAGFETSGSPLQADDGTSRQRWVLPDADMPIVTTTNAPSAPGDYSIKSVEVAPPVGYADYWCVPVPVDETVAYDLSRFLDACNNLAAAVANGSEVPVASSALQEVQIVNSDVVKAYIIQE